MRINIKLLGLLILLKRLETENSVPAIGNAGKIYDTRPIKSGGRIERYWMETDINELGWGGPKGYDRKHWHYSPEEVQEKFQLYGIEFGRWMNQWDREYFLTGTAVGLKDLATVLNWPKKFIGLNDTLSMSLGARGMGGSAAAHYTPAPYELINLTKTNGPGALAHEYGHALDFFTANYFKLKNPPSGGRSVNAKELDKNVFYRPGVIQFDDSLEFIAAYQKLFDKLLGTPGDPTEFKIRIKDYPRYWKSRVEIWARTFESYTYYMMEKNNIRNPFLQRNVLNEVEYPTRKEIEKVLPEVRKIIRLTQNLIVTF